MKHAALFPFALVALCFANSFSPPTYAATIYGVAVEGSVQSLVTWDSAAPGTLLSNMPITGLPAGETIRGIDFDPFFAPGFQRLFAIGAGSNEFANVYRIQVQSGFASKLPPSGAPPAPVFGQQYGVDVPRSTAIKSIDNTRQLSAFSTTFNSGGGDGTVAYASGDVNAGQTPRTVHFAGNFIIDTATDSLTTFVPGGGSPNPISTVGFLGADFDDAGAIDIDAADDTAYAALLPAGQTQSRFYKLNLQTGATTLIGAIAGDRLITAMAVEPPISPVPEPQTAFLLFVGLVGIVSIRHQLRTGPS